MPFTQFYKAKFLFIYLFCKCSTYDIFYGRYHNGRVLREVANFLAFCGVNYFSVLFIFANESKRIRNLYLFHSLSINVDADLLNK